MSFVDDNKEVIAALVSVSAAAIEAIAAGHSVDASLMLAEERLADARAKLKFKDFEK